MAEPTERPADWHFAGSRMRVRTSSPTTFMTLGEDNDIVKIEAHEYPVGRPIAVSSSVSGVKWTAGSFEIQDFFIE